MICIICFSLCVIRCVLPFLLRTLSCAESFFPCQQLHRSCGCVTIHWWYFLKSYKQLNTKQQIWYLVISNLEIGFNFKQKLLHYLVIVVLCFYILFVCSSNYTFLFSILDMHWSTHSSGQHPGLNEMLVCKLSNKIQFNLDMFWSLTHFLFFAI